MNGRWTSETFDVGMDTASPAADDYSDQAPFKFEGTLGRLNFANLEPMALTSEPSRGQSNAEK